MVMPGGGGRKRKSYFLKNNTAAPDPRSNSKFNPVK
jgi:hypothetical protein